MTCPKAFDLNSWDVRQMAFFEKYRGWILWVIAITFLGSIVISAGAFMR
jgi:hypothetical protein